MKRRERITIYTLLLVLLALQTSALLARSGRPAYASGEAMGQDLGPAEAVTLVGDEPLELRNRDGRLSWGDEAHERSYSTAYVYIGKILNALMQSEERQEDRERLGGELQEKEIEYRARLDDISERLKTMDPETDEAKSLYEEGTVLYQEYMQWQQGAVVERGKLDAGHLEQAYRELIDAVEVVGDRRNIDLVYRFIPTSEPFTTENPEQAMLAIRMRTALRYPSELDITDAVIEELSLDVDEP